MNFRANALDRQGLERAADWLAVAVAVSLPWSTSATGILVVLWLLAVLPTLDVASVRRELATAAGGLPVLLWALAAFGMLWADVSWRERLGGFDSYQRLLVLPLLLAQFRRSEFGFRVLLGFFLSVSGVLLFSWALVLFPSLPWRSPGYGVPVKDYILQSTDFLMCAVVLLTSAIDDGRAGRWRSVAWPIALAALFLANIAFVVTGRTTLLVAPVLIVLLGWRKFGLKGALGATMLFCVIGAGTAVESPYLYARLKKSIKELEKCTQQTEVPQADIGSNSTCQHLELVKRSISFVLTAPVIGHGTGSIPEQYQNAAAENTATEPRPPTNPHNQILAVAVQLGLVGAAVLVAMWAAHFMLFRDSGLNAWIGIIIVTQNVVSSLFNSHLFDFTQGWLYVFGVGVAGGTALRERVRRSGSHEADPDPA
jgi:O-antigen ligase